MGGANNVIKALVGHRVRIYYESIASGTGYEVEGVLEEVGDHHITMRVGGKRVIILNALVIEIHDYGVVEDGVVND